MAEILLLVVCFFLLTATVSPLFFSPFPFDFYQFFLLFACSLNYITLSHFLCLCHRSRRYFLSPVVHSLSKCNQRKRWHISSSDIVFQSNNHQASLNCFNITIHLDTVTAEMFESHSFSGKYDSKLQIINFYRISVPSDQRRLHKA